MGTDVHERYEYLKEMSKKVTELLENEKFCVTPKEYRTFIELLKLEATFKYGFTYPSDMDK